MTEQMTARLAGEADFDFEAVEAFARGFFQGSTDEQIVATRPSDLYREAPEGMSDEEMEEAWEMFSEMQRVVREEMMEA